MSPRRKTKKTPAFLLLSAVWASSGCRRIGTSRRLVPSTFSHPGGPIRDWITDNGTSLGLVPNRALSGGPTKTGLVPIRAQSGGFELVGTHFFQGQRNFFVFSSQFHTRNISFSSAFLPFLPFPFLRFSSRTSGLFLLFLPFHH